MEMKEMKARIVLMTLAVSLMLFGAACSDDDNNLGGDMLDSRMDIVQTASSAGQFNTLLAAAQAAGLAETLADGGPFTVFAPTDAAFQKLGSTVDDLLKPENEDTLRAILLYHVISGEFPASAVVEETALTTLQGSNVQIMVMGSTVKINDATLLQPDVEASNGIIHIIDTVLVP